MSLAELTELDATYHMPVYARSPIAFVRGSGTQLFDSDGTAYLDLLAGIAVASVGHCHPRVVEAISTQAATLDHVSNLYLTEPQIRLAERLHAFTGFGRVFFANSGAEANECALKLARRASATRHGTPRAKVVAIDGGFHGRTFATLAATGQPSKHAPFQPLPDWFTHVPLNYVSALEAAVDDQTGAVILEIIQGEGGVRVATDAFLEAARRRCDEVGAILIIDEVQTGLGRTGSNWAFEQTSIVPDIITVAKALGGGIPISATIAREDIADAFAAGDHATTFGGGPIPCAAALATLDVIEDEGLVERAAMMGEVLGDALRALTDPRIIEIRGRGLLVGMALSVPAAAQVVDAARARGVIVGTAGPDVVRFAPPLIVTAEELGFGVTAVAEALGSIT